MEHEHFNANSNFGGMMGRCNFRYIICCSELHYGYYRGRLLFYCPICNTCWYVRKNEIPNAKTINANLKTSEFIQDLLAG